MKQFGENTESIHAALIGTPTSLLVATATGLLVKFLIG
jgi:hypothetical protein